MSSLVFVAHFLAQFFWGAGGPRGLRCLFFTMEIRQRNVRHFRIIVMMRLQYLYYDALLQIGSRNILSYVSFAFA